MADVLLFPPRTKKPLRPSTVFCASKLKSTRLAIRWLFGKSFHTDQRLSACYNISVCSLTSEKSLVGRDPARVLGRSARWRSFERWRTRGDSNPRPPHCEQWGNYAKARRHYHLAVFIRP